MNRHQLKISSQLLPLILLCGLISTPAPARVSWRWGTVSQSSKALSSAGGTSAYEAGLNINGATADLNVFSFEESCDKLVSQLAGLFPDSFISYRQGTMAFFIARDNKTVIRIVLLQLTAESHTLAVKIEQTKEDYEASIRPPAIHLLAEMPEFPSSTPRFYAANNDTDIQLASASSSSGPAEIKAFYSQRLASQGWLNPMPASSSLLVFVKGNAVCTVMTNEAGEQGQTFITLLHKMHGVK